jgi:flagellar basal-body rod protein FlgB
MPVNLDAYLGVHAAALKLRAQRTSLRIWPTRIRLATGRATSISRVRLPLRGSPQGGVHLATTSAGHIGGTNANGTAATELKYRTPLAPSLDGNTVDAQLEQAAFAENTVRYQATLSFLSSKFRGLLTAITGQHAHQDGHIMSSFKIFDIANQITGVARRQSRGFRRLRRAPADYFHVGSTSVAKSPDGAGWNSQISTVPSGSALS